MIHTRFLQPVGHSTGFKHALMRPEGASTGCKLPIIRPVANKYLIFSRNRSCLDKEEAFRRCEKPLNRECFHFDTLFLQK